MNSAAMVHDAVTDKESRRIGIEGLALWSLGMQHVGLPAAYWAAEEGFRRPHIARERIIALTPSHAGQDTAASSAASN